MTAAGLFNWPARRSRIEIVSVAMPDSREAAGRIENVQPYIELSINEVRFRRLHSFSCFGQRSHFSPRQSRLAEKHAAQRGAFVESSGLVRSLLK